MNVYVGQLGAALAQRRLEVVLFTRRTRSDQPEVVSIEPGLRVVHIDAGAHRLPKDELGETAGLFADGVERFMHSTGFEPQVLHANYWLSAESAMQLQQRLGIPFTVTFHTLARVKNAAGDPEPRSRELAEQRIVDSAAGICAASPADIDDLAHLYGADPNRVALVPPGVVHAFFSPGSKRGARWALGFDDGPLLLFIGRIQPLKGADVAVQALAELGREDVRLVLVGGPSGPQGESEMQRVRNLAAARGMSSRVHFVEPQPHHILATYYRSADAVLVPSRSESFGLVALEAAACGRPVVAADVGGLRYIVADGASGVLVPGRDPTRWAHSIGGILDDPERAERMGRAAFERSELFTWGATAERAIAHYESLVR
jgi:D-inositol-3-phosphate glycosyltransferase